MINSFQIKDVFWQILANYIQSEIKWLLSLPEPNFWLMWIEVQNVHIEINQIWDLW